MSLAFLDPYQPNASPVHRTEASTKLAAVFAFLIILNLTPILAWPAFVADLVALVAVARMARLSFGSVARRSMLAAPFVLMAAAGMPFVQQGEPLFAIPVFSWRLTVTDVGLLRLLNVVCKSWLSVLAVILLSLTTHFIEIVKAMHKLGVPRVLAAVIMLMYRYIYVLVGEATRLVRAREARTAGVIGERKSRSIVWRAQVTGHMIGTLFLRTYERSERIYGAMLARGYAGEMRTLRPPALTPLHALTAGAALVALAIVAVVAASIG